MNAPAPTTALTDSSGPQPDHMTVREWAAMLGVLSAGLIVRLIAMPAEPLWLDELHTAWTVQGDWSEVPLRAGLGNHLPMFFQLVWLGSRCGLPAIWGLRTWSLAAGGFLPGMLFFIVRRWTRSTFAATVAGLLAALDGDFIFFSLEARPYALVQWLAAAHVYLLARNLSAKASRGWWMWTLVGVVLLRLHITTALVLLAESLAGLVLCFASRDETLRRQWRPLVLHGGMVALSSLLLLNYLGDLFPRRNDWQAFVEPPTAAALLSAVPLGPCWPLIVGAILPAAVARRRGRPSETPAETLPLAAGAPAVPPVSPVVVVMLTIFWLVLPLIVAWLATSTGLAPLLHSRYLVGSAAAAIVLAVLAGLIFRSQIGRRLYWTMLLIAGLFSQTWIEASLRERAWPAERHEDWQAAAAWLNENVSVQPQPVLLRSGLLESDRFADSPDPMRREYCVLPFRSLFRLREGIALRPLPLGDAEGFLQTRYGPLITEAGGCWVVYRMSDDPPLSKAMVYLAIGGTSRLELTAYHTCGEVAIAHFELVRKDRTP